MQYIKFKHFVSLGFNCGVAYALEKNGLREASGPFDWYISHDFESVISVLENNFEDFMLKENIQIIENKTSVFKDIKYNFLCGNDIKLDYRMEFEGILKKYARRVENFKRYTKEPTCFIRRLSSLEDYYYSIRDFEHIEKVIKKNNKNSEIIFLVDESFADKIKIIEFPYFIVDEHKEGKSLKGILIDSNKELLEYCISTYDGTNREENLSFALQGFAERFYIVDERCKSLMKIQDNSTIENLPNKFIIYGVGHVGKAFYNKFCKDKNVVAFVDKNIGGRFNNIPIIGFLDLQQKKYAGIPIYVTATFDYQIIKRCLADIIDNEVISIMDILK